MTLSVCGILQISLLNIEVFVILLQHVINICTSSHRQQTPRIHRAVRFKPPEVLCSILYICEMFTAYGVCGVRLDDHHSLFWP